jgi:dTDP-4-amino-4,6-dideoxygalactose transaminase
MQVLGISLRLVNSEVSMKPIQMTDLVTQYNKLKPEIDAAIGGVLEHGIFINGPEVKRFASELQTYMGVRHVIPCANGTDALQIALMSLDIPAGSEIITPAFSYAAIVEVCSLLRLKPVFVDVDPNTFNMDVNHLESYITDKTKAIIPVHLFGQCANMNTILRIASKHKLFVIEDNAQAIGAEYLMDNGIKKKSGTMSDVSTISFFPSKNLGCFGDGGAVCTDDDALAEKIRMIANHGQRVKYYHELVGVNSRLDSIQAAVLSVKLRQLDDFTEERRAVAQRYNEAFKELEGIQVPSVDTQSTHVYHQYTLRILSGNVDSIRHELKERGVPTMVYYPEPLYKQKAYFEDLEFENTEMLCKQVLSLPMGTDMSNEQVDYIIKQFTDIIKQK